MNTNKNFEQETVFQPETDDLGNFTINLGMCRALEHCGITTLRGVAKLTKEEILALPKFRAAYLPDLEALLKENGLDFATKSTGGAPVVPKEYPTAPYVEFEPFDLAFADAWISREENLSLIRKVCNHYGMSFVTMMRRLPGIIYGMRQMNLGLSGLDATVAMLNEQLRDCVMCEIKLLTQKGWILKDGDFIEDTRPALDESKEIDTAAHLGNVTLNELSF